MREARDAPIGVTDPPMETAASIADSWFAVVDPRIPFEPHYGPSKGGAKDYLARRGRPSASPIERKRCLRGFVAALCQQTNLSGQVGARALWYLQRCDAGGHYIFDVASESILR